MGNNQQKDFGHSQGKQRETLEKSYGANGPLYGADGATLVGGRTKAFGCVTEPMPLLASPSGWQGDGHPTGPK